MGRNNVVYPLTYDPNFRTAVKVKLIDLISDRWSIVNGHLYAPKSLVDQDFVIKDVKLVLSRDSTKPFYVCVREDTTGNQDKQKQKIEPILNYDILMPGRFPMNVEFDNAGVGNIALSFAQARQFARFFTSKGYTGHLEFILYENNSIVRIKKLMVISDYEYNVEVAWSNNSSKGDGLEKILDFLKDDAVILENEMRMAAEAEEFEKAANLRDLIKQIREQRRELQ